MPAQSCWWFRRRENGTPKSFMLKEAKMPTWMFFCFFPLIPLTLVLWVREAELCVLFIHESLWMFYRAYMSIGYWGAAQLLGYLRIHWRPETWNCKAVFFFFSCLFFLAFFAGDAVEYLYRLGVSGLPALDSSYRRVFCRIFPWMWLWVTHGWLVKITSLFFLYSKVWDHLGTWWDDILFGLHGVV